MHLEEDCYVTLGVSRECDDKTLKSAYRKEAMRWHPDRNGSANAEDKLKAEEKFKAASIAYWVLSDADRRCAYDQNGFNGIKDIKSPFEGFSKEDFMSYCIHNFGDIGQMVADDFICDLEGGRSNQTVPQIVDDFHTFILSPVAKSLKRPDFETPKLIALVDQSAANAGEILSEIQAACLLRSPKLNDKLKAVSPQMYDMHVTQALVSDFGRLAGFQSAAQKHWELRRDMVVGNLCTFVDLNPELSGRITDLFSKFGLDMPQAVQDRISGRHISNRPQDIPAVSNPLLAAAAK